MNFAASASIHLACASFDPVSLFIVDDQTRFVLVEPRATELSRKRGQAPKPNYHLYRAFFFVVAESFLPKFRRDDNRGVSLLVCPTTSQRIHWREVSKSQLLPRPCAKPTSPPRVSLRAQSLVNCARSRDRSRRHWTRLECALRDRFEPD